MSDTEKIAFCEFCGEKTCTGVCDKFRTAEKEKHVKFYLQTYLDGARCKRYELKDINHTTRAAISELQFLLKKRFSYEIIKVSTLKKARI